MHRKDPLTAGLEITCFQWLSRIPEESGAVMVLRYNARAEEGTSRVRIVPRLPVLIPKEADDAGTKRLRLLSEPLHGVNTSPAIEPRVCTLRDWVRPQKEWHTYAMIWEWPSFCNDGSFRNIEITQVGLGKVWIDNVELFTLAKRVQR